MSNASRRHSEYIPALWEKITVAVAACAVLSLIGWLVVRNAPFNDPNLVVMLRIVLSLAIAALGAAVPGFLGIGIKASGVAIRAGGALALFVISFFFTPTVITPSAANTNPTQPSPTTSPDNQPPTTAKGKSAEDQRKQHKDIIIDGHKESPSLTHTHTGEPLSSKRKGDAPSIEIQSFELITENNEDNDVDLRDLSFAVLVGDQEVAHATAHGAQHWSHLTTYAPLVSTEPVHLGQVARLRVRVLAHAVDWTAHFTLRYKTKDGAIHDTFRSSEINFSRTGDTFTDEFPLKPLD